MNDIHQIRLILPDIARYSLMLKGKFFIFLDVDIQEKFLEIDYAVNYLQYFVLISVKSSCFCITVIGAKAPLELAHVKDS